MDLELGGCWLSADIADLTATVERILRGGQGVRMVRLGQGWAATGPEDQREDSEWSLPQGLRESVYGETAMPRDWAAKTRGASSP
ncbi:hypothetical protein GCM10023319_10270 [Nocardia iowensis]